MKADVTIFNPGDHPRRLDVRRSDALLGRASSTCSSTARPWCRAGKITAERPGQPIRGPGYRKVASSRRTVTVTTLPMSAVLAGLSAALDITEGHPRGHAARTCLIAMRLADALRLSPDESSDLFYAALLKDAGCSSNAARVFQMFGGPDEHATKRAVWLRDWRKLDQKVALRARVGRARGRLPRRACASSSSSRRSGPRGERELFEIRCARSAAIARALGMSEATAQAVQSMDEHWDGGGHPAGLQRRARFRSPRASSASRKSSRSSGAWPGPIARSRWRRSAAAAGSIPSWSIACRRSRRPSLWASLETDAISIATVAAAEPAERAIEATGERLDQIADRVCVGHRREVELHVRAFRSRRRAGARRRRAARFHAGRADAPAPRRAAPRHRQARRAQRDSRQARQAHRRGMGRREAASRAYAARPAAGAGVSRARRGCGEPSRADRRQGLLSRA